MEKFFVSKEASRRNGRDEIEDGLSDFFASREKEYSSKGIEEVPKGLLTIEQLGELLRKARIDSSEVYNWYQRAMERRGRIPLEKERFVSLFLDGYGEGRGNYAFGDAERGFLFGRFTNGIFIPSHLAPKSIFAAYELFQELRSHKAIPVLLAITDDLAKTIEKMSGWQVSDESFPASFRGEMVLKKVAYNSNPRIKELLEALRKNISGLG